MLVLPMYNGMGAESCNFIVRRSYQKGGDHFQHLGRCFWYVWSVLNVSFLSMEGYFMVTSDSKLLQFIGVELHDSLGIQGVVFFFITK